jgi:hypothetical protein
MLSVIIAEAVAKGHRFFLSFDRYAFEYYNADRLKQGERTMRTTIELSDNHRSALHSMAARRGLRGYSKLIQEAIDLYIRDKEKKRDGTKDLLKLRGAWNEGEAKEIKQRLEEIRRSWRIR